MRTIEVKNNGQADVSGMLSHPDAFVRGRAERAVQLTAELKKRMSPAGALNLPALLEQRRWEIGIPDGVFAQQALFDRVLIYQFNANASEYYEGTAIAKPDNVNDREKHECPTGVVISAGLKALDVLRSNGVDLGHIVKFAKLAVYRLPVDSVAGMQQHVIVQNVGAIVASVDLEMLARKKTVHVVREGQEHYFVDQEGVRWDPQLPNEQEE